MTGDDPVPVTFGPKGSDPNRKDARFTFRTRRAVQSAIADVLVNFMPSGDTTDDMFTATYCAQLRYTFIFPRLTHFTKLFSIITK